MRRHWTDDESDSDTDSPSPQIGTASSTCSDDYPVARCSYTPYPQLNTRSYIPSINELRPQAEFGTDTVENQPYKISQSKDDSDATSYVSLTTKRKRHETDDESDSDTDLPPRQRRTVGSTYSDVYRPAYHSYTPYIPSTSELPPQSGFDTDTFANQPYKISQSQDDSDSTAYTSWTTKRKKRWTDDESVSDTDLPPPQRQIVESTHSDVYRATYHSYTPYVPSTSEIRPRVVFGTTTVENQPYKVSQVQDDSDSTAYTSWTPPIIRQPPPQSYMPSVDESRLQITNPTNPICEEQKVLNYVLENEYSDLLTPPIIDKKELDAAYTILAASEISPKTYTELIHLAGRLQTLNNMSYHYALLFSRWTVSTKLTKHLRNMSFRAFRHASTLPDKFSTVGKSLGEGEAGEAFLIKTHAGKRYVLKKCMMASLDFEYIMTEILRESTAMMLSNRNDYIIHIKGSWICSYPEQYVVYTAMEFADFGDLKTYVDLSRPGMLTLVEDSTWGYGTDSTKASMIETALSASRQREVENEVFYYGFRSILLRFSKEVINGLVFMHRTGISHNDLHSGNILIGKGFHVKIADFGRASINHPLYGKNILRKDCAEMAEIAGIDRFAESLNKMNKDYDFYVEFLLFIVSGLTSDLGVLRNELMTYVMINSDEEKENEDNVNSTERFMKPFIRNALFYDEFLLKFSSNIVDKLGKTRFLDWDISIENELHIFSNRFGSKFSNFNVTPYVLSLYDPNLYNPELESIDIFHPDEVEQEKLFYEQKHKAFFKRVNGVGFLDESFLRDEAETAGATSEGEEGYE